MLLDTIGSPADLRALPENRLEDLAREIREFVVRAVSVSAAGGHLGSNLGAVELTIALHRVFESPRDPILWDTGHQAYVHKLLTGRRAGFERLRQADGLSGYPNRAESEHDWVENSHASTILSYAHGLVSAFETSGTSDRRVVAVIGDGSMTGGMAFEALNNLGHSGKRCVIVLNDNGRSYAPTVSKLGESLTRLRLHPSFVRSSARVEETLRELPGVGELAFSSIQGLKAAFREVLEPPAFFEPLGIRYVGPIDGHDIGKVEQALRHAAEFDGPIVVHVLTHKGHGYPPAEDDDEKHLHDVSVVFDPITGPPAGWAAPKGYTEAFSQSIMRAAEQDQRVVAITAAMPGPTGLLPFQARFPDRFVDVGIAEQHAVTMAAGMAMGGLKPVVAVYSTFFARAFDQANLDVGLHELPVVFALDRAGITGDDGASHHGVLDLALTLRIPGMTVFAPSSVEELDVMLRTALTLDGPSVVRYAKGAARSCPEVGTDLTARKVTSGSDVCILAVGKLLEAAEQAASILDGEGISTSVWDVRVVSPLDPAMIADAARHRLVVTVEDGMRVGGAGSSIVDALASLQEDRTSPPVLNLGTPHRYIPQGKPDQILRELGLDGAGIAASTLKAVPAGSTLEGLSR